MESDEPGALPSALFDVTCHTDGCWNEGKPQQVWVTLEKQIVICGPCGQLITDIVQPASGVPPEA